MITGTATIGVDRDLADRDRADQDRYHDRADDRDRDLANLDRADFDRDRLRLSGFDDFFMGFVCVLRNK